MTLRNLEERFSQYFGYSLVSPNEEFANGPSPKKNKSGSIPSEDFIEQVEEL